MCFISATLWVGLDVHKECVTAVLFRNRDAEPVQVDRLPNDHNRIRRYFERLSAAGTPRACYEPSGASYVLQRALTEWGVPFFKTHAAMALATELGDLRRFESPRQPIAYVGLVPSEHSSGDRRGQAVVRIRKFG